MRKGLRHLLFASVIGGTLTIPAHRSYAMSKGGYMTSGVVSAIGCTVLGIGCISSLAAGDTTTGAVWMGLGAAVLGGVSAYCFNHAMKTYGAMIDISDKGVALGLPTIWVNERGTLRAEFIQVQI